MEHVTNGFSNFMGDISLAKILMKDVLPHEFSDDSNSNPNSDPDMKISVDNLYKFYVEFYMIVYEKQLRSPLAYFHKVRILRNCKEIICRWIINRNR